MAPEMVIMMNQSSNEEKAYTHTVDWWSFGVTIFHLLTGFRPFSDRNVNTFVEKVNSMKNQNNENQIYDPEYVSLFQKIPFPNYLPLTTVDLISKLLDVNPATRLGSGSNGVYHIKAHEFFKGIDWDLLEQKHIEPPFKPENSRVFDTYITPSTDFESFMVEFDKEDWLKNKISEDDQKYFADWYVFQYNFLFSFLLI
jgi:serine/threonine protein kinase